ncbi:hypothetical protein A0H81_12875 [Grifola frondosa]|uniref:Uncharacterized protein n=1 Tax=Grifola frondosa TaxID=5627 RepID=A0A1C7LWU3_GRIFR|nr:hypothetical protein A0H81_12875 [Grifola frondosa]
MFLTLSLYTRISGQSLVAVSGPLAGETAISAIYPQPVALDPYILKANPEPLAVTACLWLNEDDIDTIPAWATRWTGPISLVVTTAATPSSDEHATLLRKLSALESRSPLLHSTLSLHVLHLAPHTDENPNAFLNLARLLALTPRVALFPGNLTVAPPKTLYHTILTQAPASPSPSSSVLHRSKQRRKPAILTLRGQTAFPFAPLAPAVLGRDDALWCTERFFPALSRAADWEECLWQIWLEHFGDVDVRQTQGWLHDAAPALRIDPPASSVTMKLRRRLVAKYRSETCVLAGRQLAALRSSNKVGDAQKMRWLKRMCRGWTTTT